MFSVWTPSPPPPHAKAYASRNRDTKLIFDASIDDPEWKTPIDFGEKLVHAITSKNAKMHPSSFDVALVAIDMLGRKSLLILAKIGLHKLPTVVI